MHQFENEEVDENDDATPRTQDRWGEMDRQLLDFERLEVYRCAIEFLGIAVQVTAHMPRGQADLRDQLRVVSMLSKMCR